jgi:hypothetical protein
MSGNGNDTHTGGSYSKRTETQTGASQPIDTRISTLFVKGIPLEHDIGDICERTLKIRARRIEKVRPRGRQQPKSKIACVLFRSREEALKALEGLERLRDEGVIPSLQASMADHNIKCLSPQQRGLTRGKDQGVPQHKKQAKQHQDGALTASMSVDVVTSSNSKASAQVAAVPTAKNALLKTKVPRVAGSGRTAGGEGSVAESNDALVAQFQSLLDSAMRAFTMQIDQAQMKMHAALEQRAVSEPARGNEDTADAFDAAEKARARAAKDKKARASAAEARALEELEVREDKAAGKERVRSRSPVDRAARS